MADHWHLYAHGYQVITVSVDALDLYLLVIELDTSTSPPVFSVAREVAVASTGTGTSTFSFGLDLADAARTNDHHTVIYDDTDTSVAVCVGSPIESAPSIAGHYVIKVNVSDGSVTELGELGDAVNMPFNFESSAIRVDQTDSHSAYRARLISASGTGYEWQVLATGALDTDSASATYGANTLYLLASTTLDGTPSSLRLGGSEPPTAMLEMTRADRNGDYHELAMATQVLFTNGWRAVVFRDRLASLTLGTGADAGDIFLWLLDGNLDFAMSYTEAVPLKIGGGARGLRNRPHASRFSDGTTDDLLVCFDAAVGALLRAYRIDYA